MSKLLASIKEAIEKCELRDGMTISFHHHMRNGDYVLNMVLDEIAKMGIKDLTVNASSVFDVHEPIIGHIKNGVVTGIECNYMGGKVGKAISEGIMDKPVIFRSHGGRASDMEKGTSVIDVAFIAAPTADDMGNCTGKVGKSACGSIGYAFADAMNAKKVVVITDNLVEYPLVDFSIPEVYVDYVVAVDQIGNPAGIVSGTTKITRDPVGLKMASYAAKVIEASGLLKDGFSFQTGAGGATLATAKYVKDMMLEKGIQGSFGMGGITGYMVDMLEAGCFKALLDVQCFDLKAVESIRSNPKHMEVSATQYAGVSGKSAGVDSLDVVLLGATQVDLDFNVNVHTDSNGYIMGGSGGHCDTAAGAKLAIIIAPLTRARLPLVVDRCLCISTPGKTVDVVVTQRGIAVNTEGGKNVELKEKLKEAKLPVVEIADLKRMAEEIAGVPKPVQMGDKVVADQLSEKNDINMVMVYSALASMLDSNPMVGSMPMMDALKGATLASSVNFEKGRIVCDAAMSYKDKESEQKMMDFYAYVKPQTGALLRYVPRNTIGAMAYGLDGEKMYSVFSAMPGYGMLMANPMVKQVMDAFSGDCVISFSGMTADGQYPVASLLAQVKDPAVLQTIVSNLSGMPIQKAGEGEYTISMGGVTVLFGVKGDVLYCTTDAVVKSALDGADIESLASMSKIFKGQSGSFYVDFEGVTALTAQLVGGNVDPQVEAALSVLAMFEDLEAYGTMKGGTAVVNMTDKEQNSFKTICDKIGELIRLYVPEANL